MRPVAAGSRSYMVAETMIKAGDGLLMRKVGREPGWEGIAIYSERAKRIGEMVRRDWRRVAAN